MRKIFTIIVLSVIILKTHAQMDISPGIRAGLSGSGMMSGEMTEKVGFYAGGFAEMNFGGKYSFQPELIYIQQGATYMHNQVDEDKVSLNYLSLGLMNKISFTENFYAIGGISLDYLMSYDFPDGLIEDEEDLVVKWDWALSLGAGYRLPIGVILEARFKIGLIDPFADTDYHGDDTGVPDDGYDYYTGNVVPDAALNYAITFGAAYKF